MIALLALAVGCSREGPAALVKVPVKVRGASDTTCLLLGTDVTCSGETAPVAAASDAKDLVVSANTVCWLRDRWECASSDGVGLEVPPTDFAALTCFSGGAGTAIEGTWSEVRAGHGVYCGLHADGGLFTWTEDWTPTRVDAQGAVSFDCWGPQTCFADAGGGLGCVETAWGGS